MTSCIYWIPTDQRPTTDLAFWNISNGHISATDHPIHLMLGSRVGFLRSSDRMALFPVGANPRWRPAVILEFFEWPYLCNGSSDTQPVCIGFSDEIALLTVGENPKWRPAAIFENVKWSYFCNWSCDSLCIWFYGRVFGSADRMSLLPVGPNSRSRPSAVLCNF